MFKRTHLLKIFAVVIVIALVQWAMTTETQAAPPSSGGDIYHVVQHGETVFSIGRLYNIDPYVIANYNKLHNPDIIYAGQILLIPVHYSHHHYPNYYRHHQPRVYYYYGKSHDHYYTPSSKYYYYSDHKYEEPTHGYYYYGDSSGHSYDYNSSPSYEGNYSYDSSPNYSYDSNPSYNYDSSPSYDGGYTY